jgi:hypothetical protein
MPDAPASPSAATTRVASPERPSSAHETAVTDPDLARPAPDHAGPRRDPFAPIEASPRGRGVLVVLALFAAVAAAITGLAPIAGPVGMALGLLAHVKGSRLGVPVAVLAGVAMILGFTVTFLLR